MKKKRINYFKSLSLFFAIAVLVFITGCNGTPPAVPIINSFSAVPSTITEGESSTLSWSVTDATSVTIDNGIGSVALTGTFAVNPTTTTTYTLTATNSAGSVIATCTVTVNPAAVAVGNSYGGGIVAYILQRGDPGYDANVQHGLIAATADQSTGIQWYIGSSLVTGATGTAIGTGQANTTAIVTIQGAGSYAAQLCNDLTVGSYSDWFLPSKDELAKLYIERVKIGNFASDGYWSSSENNAFYAWYQNFYNGSQSGYSKYYTSRVRAVRAF